RGCAAVPARGADPLHLVGRVAVAGGVRGGLAASYVLGPGDVGGDRARRRQASGGQGAGGLLGGRVRLWAGRLRTGSGTTCTPARWRRASSRRRSTGWGRSRPAPRPSARWRSCVRTVRS